MRRNVQQPSRRVLISPALVIVVVGEQIPTRIEGQPYRSAQPAGNHARLGAVGPTRSTAP